MTDTQLMAAVYRCELKLESHAHRVENDDLDEAIKQLRELRKDLTPESYFGDEYA